jgi:hypothetical protein
LRSSVVSSVAFLEGVVKRLDRSVNFFVSPEEPVGRLDPVERPPKLFELLLA